MKPKLSIEVVVTNYYTVTDCYNQEHRFDSYSKAVDFFEYTKKERKVLNLIKPKGVTLVVSNNPSVFYKVYPGFLGYNGVPFCECTKEKDRPYFYNLINSVERYSSIYGSLINVLKKTYNLLHKVETFDRRDGAYHYQWNTEVGNTYCIAPSASDVVWNNHYWYNWDGENFTTNDPDCLVTSSDFK